MKERVRLGSLWLAAVITTALAGSSALAASPLPATSASPGSGADTPARVLWLRGPFGTVPGVVGTPSSSAGRPLDAYVRSAPLRLESGDPDVLLAEWHAVFRAQDPSAADVEAGGTGDGGVPASGVSVAAPDVPGSYRLDASASIGTGVMLEGSWNVQVPDRELPADGLIDVPAPRLLLTAAAGTAAGWPGSGCHIYLCVDVGRLAPLRMVPSLEVAEGEPLVFRLSDDSGIAGWKVTFYPVASRVQLPVDELGEEPEQPVEAFGVPAPVAGDWLIQVEVVYDRLRGWTHAFFRLTSR
jgi:hypothetical protein